MTIKEQCLEIKSCVYKKINKLNLDAEQGKSSYKAELAELRRGVGHKPGELASVTGILLEALPEKFFGFGNTPSYAEWAVYIALTLFAVHQQSSDIENELMHQQGEYIGKAIARLIRDENDRERIIRKMTALLKSKDVEDLSHHLKSMIYLLRSENIKVDYADLAQDIYKFQIGEFTSSVQLKWGRDFYRYALSKEIESEKEKSNGKE